MSNVLPENARKKLRSNYRARFITVASLMAIATALLCAVALAPMYVSLRLEIGALPDMGNVAPDASDRATLQHTQSLLRALKPVLATTTPSMAIDASLAARPSGVTVTSISYTAGQLSTLYISGSASRDTINQYQQKLQSTAMFDKVVIPLGDLAGAGDGTFTVTISGQF